MPDDDYLGYTNYMRYWARNGQPSWICNTAAYNNYDPNPDVTSRGSGYQKVRWTYEEQNFWKDFDPKKDGGQESVLGGVIDKNIVWPY